MHMSQVAMSEILMAESGNIESGARFMLSSSDKIHPEVRLLSPGPFSLGAHLSGFWLLFLKAWSTMSPALKSWTGQHHGSPLMGIYIVLFIIKIYYKSHFLYYIIYIFVLLMMGLDLKTSDVLLHCLPA